jgi:RHS repeat-associated protein
MIMTKPVTLRIKQALVVLCGAGLLFAALAAHAGDIVTYVHTDRLGNPVAKTDSTGAVIWRQSYTPYGETDQQPDPDGPGYTGHRHDAATGLVYMQARYYDPKIGRFLSPDPVTYAPGRSKFFNRYWYASGNPYKYTDPTGRCAPGICEGMAQSMGQAFMAHPEAAKQTLIFNASVAAAALGAPEVAGAIKAVKILSAANKKAATLSKNVAKGKAGEAATRAKLGKNVAGEQVTFKTSDGTRTRADFVTKGKDVVETKTGNAKLSPGQSKMHADVSAGRSVTPVGKNAENAGLKSDEPTRMKSCSVDRC